MMFTEKLQTTLRLSFPRALLERVHLAVQVSATIPQSTPDVYRAKPRNRQTFRFWLLFPFRRVRPARRRLTRQKIKRM